MLKNKPKRSPLPTTEKLSPEGKKGLEKYLRELGYPETTITKENGFSKVNQAMGSFETAVALVKHLYKMEQIKVMPTEEEMKEYWDKNHGDQQEND